MTITAKTPTLHGSRATGARRLWAYTGLCRPTPARLVQS